MSQKLVTTVALLALTAVLLWLTWSQQVVECEVCIEFGGGRNCAIASAETEAEAVRNARSTACGLLARGVRDAFACDRAEPASLSCKPR
jgi:hypothetical protein